MTDPRVTEALDWLRRRSSPSVRAGMLRYAIPNDHALGVKMADIQKLARRLGCDHALANELWKTGVYEARMLCAYVDEIGKITPAQMNRQARDFDNWAICDTLCFASWVRSPHAFPMIRKWAGHRDEFVKRAAFALLASVALKDRVAADAEFERCLPLVAKAADDDRNFVKKAVSWALRGIGRRSVALNEISIALARELADREETAPRWVGKDVLRELTSAAVQKRVKSVAKRAARK